MAKILIVDDEEKIRAVIKEYALFNGYDCRPTSEGISRATTATVVQSSLAVLGLDFILTALMF